MPRETSIVKKVFVAGAGGRRRRSRQRKRWVDDLEDDLQTLGRRRWRVKAETREEWRRICRRPRPTRAVAPNGKW